MTALEGFSLLMDTHFNRIISCRVLRLCGLCFRMAVVLLKEADHDSRRFY